KPLFAGLSAQRQEYAPPVRWMRGPLDQATRLKAVEQDGGRPAGQAKMLRQGLGRRRTSRTANVVEAHQVGLVDTGLLGGPAIDLAKFCGELAQQIIEFARLIHHHSSPASYLCLIVSLLQSY